MPEEIMPNSPEARTETGELKGANPPETTPNPNAPPTPTPAPEVKLDAEGKPIVEAKPTVPEKYEFKPAEGRELDPAAIEAATPIFKELNLTNDQAQKLVELYDKMGGDRHAANEKAVVEQREAWKKDLAADKDIGSKLPEVSTNIGRAFSQMPATQVAEFKGLMDATGLGDNPIMVKMMNSFASAFNEGKYVSGNGPTKPSQDKPGAAPPSPANAMYPHLK